MNNQPARDLEQEWSDRHPNPSGLDEDDARRAAARDRATSWHEGDESVTPPEPEPAA